MAGGGGGSACQPLPLPGGLPGSGRHLSWEFEVRWLCCALGATGGKSATAVIVDKTLPKELRVSNSAVRARRQAAMRSGYVNDFNPSCIDLDGTKDMDVEALRCVGPQRCKLPEVVVQGSSSARRGASGPGVGLATPP